MSNKDLKQFTIEEVQQVRVRSTAVGRWLTWTHGTLAAQQGGRPGKLLVRDRCPPTAYNRTLISYAPLTQPFSSQWIVVDAKVYDLSRFVNLHPGGRAVLVDAAVAGQDATEAFYGLHRHEVLERPQYARLQVGVLQGEKSVITGRLVGGLSAVPYAEPTYLSKGFHSPYYTEVRAAAAAGRDLVCRRTDSDLVFFDGWGCSSSGNGTCCGVWAFFFVK